METYGISNKNGKIGDVGQLATSQFFRSLRVLRISSFLGSLSMPVRLGNREARRMAGLQKRRINPYVLRVVVSREEGAVIDASADCLGMSTSSYLRALGLGYQPIGH